MRRQVHVVLGHDLPTGVIDVFTIGIDIQSGGRHHQAAGVYHTVGIDHETARLGSQDTACVV